MLPANFPAQPGPARDAAILAAVQAGNYSVSWATIASAATGPSGTTHNATFRVFADALKIGGVRITVSAYLQQTLADMLGCSLLTAKLMDLIFSQRDLTLLPHTQVPDSTMVSTKIMVAQSQWIDAQIPSDTRGIIQTLGKSWLIDNLFVTQPATAGKAINYGWHMTSSTFQGTTWPKSVTLPNVYTIQNRGWAHAPQEVDYSQNCILVARDCIVDGLPADLQAVFQNPELAPLANADGVLKVLRQPGVPQAPLVRSPPCTGADCPDLVDWIQEPTLQAASLAPIALLMAAGGFLGGLALERSGRRRL